MTTDVDIVNRALQSIGARTTITASNLALNDKNEAKQANLIFASSRDSLLRMAPWNCSLSTANLVYITSIPGTPENQSPDTPLWQKGQPAPPWSYEYQYPNDCLRACWVIPANQTGVAGTPPIYPTSVGGAASRLVGPAIRFKTQIDQFFPVTAATVAAGGAGYAVGDEITLASGAVGSSPIGAPAVLRVLTAPAGVVATVEVVSQIIDGVPPSGGSYFSRQTNPVAQGSTTGVGVGATFNLTFGAKNSQRVILTNQQNATLAYCKRVTDANLMDELFQDAWVNILGAGICMAINGNVKLANARVVMANASIELARGVDGNEGLTINDVTPDWIRARGLWADGEGFWNNGFDWGNLWPLYGA